MCSDAVSDAERMRHRCWELDPYLDPGWPALGLGGGLYSGRGGYERKGLPLPPGPPMIGKGITRRLG